MNNWKTVKLGDVCETTSGGTPSRKNPKYYKGKIPWIKSGELNYNLIQDSEEKITKEAIENSSAKIFPKDTLLIALYGATVGRLAFLGIDAATNQAVAAIFTPENLSNKFLYWFLFSYREQLLKQRIGGAQPNISQGTLKNISLPLPPLPEQKKIVEKIEELFSGLDSGVASLKKAKEQLRLYRQSVLASAFSGRLHPATAGRHDSSDYKINRIKEKKSSKSVNPVNHGSDNLPPGWKWVKLGEVIKVSSGKGLTSASMINDGLYPVYGGNGVSGYYNDFLFEEPRLIIGRVGAKCGVIHITKPKSWVTDNALIVDFISDNVEMKFLYHCLDYHNLNKLSVSTAQPVISGAKIYPYEIMLPPLTQQTQIVSEIEKRFSEADNLEKAIDESLAKSESLRQSILKQAFSGKLIMNN